MEKLFGIFKHFLVTHKNYQGRVCGYKDDAFLLAVETKDRGKFFTELQEGTVILEEYQDEKYVYSYENESEILKQMREKGNE